MAYEELVRRYRDVAVRTATVVGGAADDAEDAAQEAFVKAYAALGRFRAGSPFKPWLLQIVANEARNRRRSAGRVETGVAQHIEQKLGDRLLILDDQHPGDAVVAAARVHHDLI